MTPSAPPSGSDVAARVLEQGPEEHAGRVYTPTGPEAVSMADVADLISTTLGHVVRHHQRTESESESFLTGLGLPSQRVEVLHSLDRFTREGLMTTVHGDTYSLLGRPARAARAYIAQTAPTLLQPAS